LTAVGAVLGDQPCDPHPPVAIAPAAGDFQVHEVDDVAEADGLPHVTW
jgi:hypothetical protein